MIEYCYLRGLLGEEIVGIADGLYRLYLCERRDIEPIICANHYSRTMPKNARFCLKVFYDGEVSGALSLGYGIRPEIKASWGQINKGEYLEFDRMWLSDVPPKNSESKVISLLVKLLRQIAPEVRYLISYADGTVGNTGTIYRASNFKELPPIKADFYILADGSRVHPVTMWHRHKTRAWAAMSAIYPGIRKAVGVQHRFILKIRDRRKRRGHIVTACEGQPG